jgi:UDP-N-acetylmuramoyl-L-alanyl-D-glutamate--2,6-diaminopimelate ligase
LNTSAHTPAQTGAPTLQDVLQGVEVAEFTGARKTPVTAIVMDSRLVRPGALFVAAPGSRTNGAAYIGEALERGAAAIITTEPQGVPRPNLAWVRVADARRALAAAALNFYRHPEKHLRTAAVTGTNGKTTVTTLLRHLMQADGGAPWGLVGTVRYELGSRGIPAHRTTPEAPELFDMMARMVGAGCEGFVMELSSHAIAQHRADGLAFEALAFTNLSRDHMDYHGGMEAYFETKARPFLATGDAAPKTVVINADDTFGQRLANRIPQHTQKILFGLDAAAAVRATDVRLHADGSVFNAVWPGGAAEIRTTLPGAYNVSNILCALALAHALGRDVATLPPVIAAFPGVPGRMERVGTGWPCRIFVDYAHTDDALKNALTMLRPITPGRLLVVFGCGGNRDRGKRPVMTGVVQEIADFAWATSDNPRKEPQEVIFEDMRAGVSDAGKIVFEEDRRHAISLALDAAREGDSLLIAGKGHEDYQEFAEVTVPFDDRLVTCELLDLKRLRPANTRG